MSDLFKRKPWLWIVIVLAVFVLLDVIFLIVAQRSPHETIEPVPPAQGTNGPAR